MCGISGIYGKPREELIRQMCQAQAHRGPEAEGIFCDHTVGLGHRRLSVIDLSAQGNQPLYNEDRSIVLVANCEIYNYKQLRKELIAVGHKFSSHSDTEVIIHLYEEYPKDFAQRLDGMFAFALWDKKKKN